MKKPRSLFFKLLVTFFLLGIGITASFLGSFRFLGDQALKKNILHNYENYIQYVLDDVGKPVTKESLERVHKKLNVAIIYNHLKSNNELPHLKDLTTSFAANDKISFARFNKQRYLIYRLGEETVALGVNFGVEEGFPFSALAGALTLSFILFLVCYIYIKKLFSPLEAIRIGAAHFAQGKFSYEIPTDTKGQLGELSASVSTMGKEIQRMLEAKRELLLAIAHELRTPLTRGKLHTELLEDPRKEEVIRNLNEMSKLVNDILETERLNLGHQALNKTMVSLDQLILSVIKDNFELDNIEVKVEHLQLECDQTLYSIVLKNIISNALKHGEGEIKIVQTKDSIVISNRGKTLEKSVLSEVFEPFYRADPSRNKGTDEGGVGLGLYLVSQIIKAHEHCIAVSSEKGITTFTISFLNSQKLGG